MRSSGVRGKVAWVDGFFEYLSDSFRPILGILLGASLIIALCAVLDALHIVDFRGDKSAGWVFVDSMWHTVFYFLPIMVAYNASKKLKVAPWLGAGSGLFFLEPWGGRFWKLEGRFGEPWGSILEAWGSMSEALGAIWGAMSPY